MFHNFSLRVIKTSEEGCATHEKTCFLFNKYKHITAGPHHKAQGKASIRAWYVLYTMPQWFSMAPMMRLMATTPLRGYSEIDTRPSI